MKNSIRTIIVVLFVCVLVVTGCSKRIKAHGEVVFSDDNSPVKAGVIWFENDKLSARGQLNENGEYSVGDLKEGGGLPPGEYRVYFTGVQETTFKQLRGPAGMGNIQSAVETPLIDAKYTTPLGTPLKAQVEPGTQEYNFTVDRPAK